MPEEGRNSDMSVLARGSGSTSTALQAQRNTALSTLLFPTESAPATDEDKVNFRDIWRVVVKRKWSIIAIFLIVVIASAVWTLMQAPLYRAEVTIKVDNDMSRVVPFQSGLALDTGDQDYFQTQLELLRSRLIAERVLAQMKVLPAAVTELVTPRRPWYEELFRKEAPTSAPVSLEEATRVAKRAAADGFRNSLVIAPLRGTKMAKVSYVSPNPRLAADLLNSLAKNFVELNIEQRFGSSTYAKKYLEEKLAETRIKLETNERALIEFQRDNGIINIDERQTVLSQSLAEYSSAVNKLEQERAKSESLVNLIRTNPEAAPQALESRSVQALKEQKAKLQAEYADQLKIYKPAFPKMQQLKAQIEETEKSIATEVDAVKMSVEASYEGLLAQQKALNAKLEQTKKDVLDIQSRSIQYNILKRDVETDRTIYNTLLTRMNEVGVTAGEGSSNITIVDTAEVPQAPFAPNLRQNLMMAMLMGLFAGIALAFFLEYLDDTLRTPEDMERLTKLPVLGVIPKTAKPSAGTEGRALAWLAHNDMRSSFSEAYRSVRTALQFATREGAPKILVVTSTSKGEGKTTTAISLAINSAHAGRPTLLIDSDLRHPLVHKSLDVDNSRGLSNYLSSDIPALAVVRTTHIPNLFVIPAGPPPPNPVELLSGPKMLSLLGLLSERFAEIILDAPPVLGLADAIVLGDQAGAVLFVVSSGTTRKAHVRAALKRLRQANVHPLGAIMSKLDLRDGMYGYESAYYYYRSSGDVPALPVEHVA